MRPRCPALPAGRFLTHAELQSIAEFNRAMVAQQSEFDAAHARVESVIRRGAPSGVCIVDSSFSQAVA
ncbi:MAG TPA: hypothetical protein VL494_13475 [Steroidobacteraceae bacterium]|jgi:hypothetical protein|nr:hypothetical protein [Steroidobacteraceae bacterium]